MTTDPIAAGDRVGKGPIVQRMRLWSGLILFAYVLFHYINHSLGHISLEAMEILLDWQEPIVGNPIGQIVLYGALLVHFGLGLWRLASLRTWRRPVWEWAQILLGLAIPYYLFAHITYTRGAQQLLGVEVDYHHELLLLWPGAALQQSFLFIVVWIHACIGLHFWLRIRSWYPSWLPFLSGLAIVIPPIALTGWISAARLLLGRLQQEAQISETSRQAYEAILGQNLYMVENLRPIETLGQWVLLALIGSAALVMVALWYAQRFGARVRVTYGDGTTVQCTPGHTLLEISQAWGIPHMSVCGGRARCSTCRTVILDGMQYLSPPTEAENQLLAKFNAGEHIRLACQCRVTGDITVRPMIPAKDGVTAPRRADPLGWGMERELAVMFVDVRGFSRISEGSLPYDVVYILNSLFDEVGAAIEGSNGYIDKFMGDGIMALFGLARPPGEACKDALRGGLAAHAAAARASLALEQHLTEPIRIGVGIHTGQAVVGRVGKTSDQVAPSRLTAIGDTVNIAARLESATKELACGLVVSLQTIDRAEISIPDHIGETSKISVHNISEPVDVVAIHDLEGLKAVMDGEIPQPPPRRDARQAKTTAKKRAPNTKSTTRKRRPRAVTTAPNTRKSRKKNLPQ